MPGLLTLVVYALAVARITRLITRDKLLDKPRDALEARLYRRAYRWIKTDADLRLALTTSDTPLPAYMLGCPWCMSIYVGALAALVAYVAGSSPWTLIPATALAFSHVTGFLASKEG